jgi:hypothetical protein
MKTIVAMYECQLLLVNPQSTETAADASIIHVCQMLDLLLFKCKDLIIKPKCLTKLQSGLAPLEGKGMRPRLLVAGSFLKEQITVCALHALYCGYEVFLLKNCTVARDPTHSVAFDARLIQAGVVPSTLWQLLYEWASNEEHEPLRRVIANLIPQS